VLATGRSDVVDSVTERGGIALLKPYSLERLEAVSNEHLRAWTFLGQQREHSRSVEARSPLRSCGLRVDPRALIGVDAPSGRRWHRPPTSYLPLIAPALYLRPFRRTIG